MRQKMRAYVIYTEPDDLYSVRSALRARCRIESAEKDKIPSTYVGQGMRKK